MHLQRDEFKCHCSPRSMIIVARGSQKTFVMMGNPISAGNFSDHLEPHSSSRVAALPAGLYAVPQGRCRAAEWALSAWAPGSFLETWEGFVFLRPSPCGPSSLPSSDSESSRDWWISFGHYSCDVLSPFTPAQICHYTATKMCGFLELEHRVKRSSWFLFVHLYGSWPPFPEAFVSRGTLGGKVLSNIIYMQFDMCIFK